MPKPKQPNIVHALPQYELVGEIMVLRYAVTQAIFRFQKAVCDLTSHEMRLREIEAKLRTQADKAAQNKSKRSK